MKETLFLFVLVAAVGIAPSRADVRFGGSFGGHGHGRHHYRAYRHHGSGFDVSFHHAGPRYYYAPSPIVVYRPPVVVTPVPYYAPAPVYSYPAYSGGGYYARSGGCGN